MKLSKSQNKELEDLYWYLDNTFKSFEGSEAWKDLHQVYQDLNELVSDLKDKIDDLEDENEKLQEQVEEYENA